MKFDMNEARQTHHVRKTALALGRTGRQFRDRVRAMKAFETGDRPLAGVFAREHEESLAVRSGTVLNLGAPNHLREARRAPIATADAGRVAVGRLCAKET